MSSCPTFFSDLNDFVEEDEDEPGILSEPGEEGGKSSSSAMQQQLDSCRKLDRHPEFVFIRYVFLRLGILYEYATRSFSMVIPKLVQITLTLVSTT